MGIFSIVITIIFTVTAFYNSFENQATNNIISHTKEISAAYKYLPDKNELQQFSNNTLRITLVDSRGKVLFESSSADTEKMENHLERPEIQQAINNGTGVSQRYSETLNTNIYYCAQKLDDGNILRVSEEISSMYSFFSEAIPYIILLIVLMLFASIVLSVILTKKLIRPINKIAEEIDKIENDSDIDGKIYDELTPFISEIHHQRMEINERLKLEKYEKNKLSAIMKNMSEGLLLIDENKNIMLASHTAEKMLKFGSESIGKNIIRVSRNQALNNSIDKAVKGIQNTDELKINDKVYSVISNPVIEENVQFATMCLIIDETDKYRMDQIKQEFTANVSHELKTPLTSISGYAEIIESGMAKDEDIKRFAEKIHFESVRMLSLVKDIIRLSELDEYDFKSEFKNVPLLATASEAVLPLYTSAEKKNISLNVTGCENEVVGDKYMINEMIYNLCDNSIKYSNQNGKVDVIVDKKKITVKDNGIGIPKEHTDRIFERFYRVDKSRSKQTGGTGLGLAIVKHIALQHNAKIELNSELNKGTEISVIFE